MAADQVEDRCGAGMATAGQAKPADLAAWLRGHWLIESLHYVRDVIFGEDATQVRSGNAPHTLAAVRNLVISLLPPWQAPPTSPRRYAETAATRSDRYNSSELLGMVKPLSRRGPVATNHLQQLLLVGVAQ